jgi:hypothetical protein
MSSQAIYDAAWHHPGIAWAAALLTAIVFARRQPFLIGWSAIFLLAVVADAWATGAFSRVPAEHAWIAGVVFVILGDLRYFALAERFAQGRMHRKAIATAVGLAFIVPVLTEIARRVVPVIGSTPRYTFLFYEVCFLILAIVMRFVVYPSRLLGVVSSPVRQWVLSIATFEIVQYGAWVACDVLLLAGVEFALLLRLVPNTLYYGVFLAFVILRAPTAAWGAPTSRASMPG